MRFLIILASCMVLAVATMAAVQTNISGIVQCGKPDEQHVLEVGVRMIREHIPVSPETDAICVALALDPLKLLASGALLIAVAPAVDSVLTSVAATGVPVVVSGEVRPASALNSAKGGSPYVRHHC